MKSVLQLNRLLASSVLIVGMALAGAASAQGVPLLVGSAKGVPPEAPVPGSGVLDLPSGQGPGVHGANSPFAPLSARADVLPWSVLTSVKTKTLKNRVVPVFTPEQTSLHEKTQRIQGFMMPLDPGEKQKHFLLSSVPLTCAFCSAGGPESLIEVRTKTPVRYSMEPQVVEGRFMVLENDPMGLYYRMTDAIAVK